MLLGKNLCGGHERCLPAGLGGLEHGVQGHEGFSGSHIALEEAVHPVRGGEVGRDFRDDVPLGCRQFKRQRCLHQLPPFSVGRLGGSALASHRGVTRADDELDAKKFLAHELRPRIFLLFEVFREMHFSPDPLGDGIPGTEQRDRGRVGFFEGAVDEHPQDARIDSIPGRMHRRDPVEMDRAFGILLDNFELRVLHDDLFAPDLRFSEDDDLLVAGDHLLDPRHVEPAADQRGAQHAGGFVLDPRLKNPARAEAAVNGFSHDAEKAHRGF